MNTATVNHATLARWRSLADECKESILASEKSRDGRQYNGQALRCLQKLAEEMDLAMAPEVTNYRGVTVHPSWAQAADRDQVHAGRSTRSGFVPACLYGDEPSHRWTAEVGAKRVTCAECLKKIREGVVR